MQEQEASLEGLRDSVDRLEKLIENHAADENTKLDGLTKEKPSALEKHAQTILVSIITATLLFVASFIYNNNKDVSNLAIKLEMVTTQISKLETKIDLLSSNYVTKSDFNELDKRVRVVEQRR